MRLPAGAVAEFQRLYKKHFGITLSRAQAESEGTKLIKLVNQIQPKKTKK